MWKVSCFRVWPGFWLLGEYTFSHPMQWFSSRHTIELQIDLQLVLTYSQSTSNSFNYTYQPSVTLS